jgi:glycine cleavage system H protein
MSEIPGELSYTDSHEWVMNDNDGSVKVGITDYAQQSLGDLVFVELPEAGETVNRGDSCAVVESVKAASDIYAPVSGEVTEVNEALIDAPELVNESPYDDGWIMKIRLTDEDELGELMDADTYESLVEEEEDDE